MILLRPAKRQWLKHLPPLRWHWTTPGWAVDSFVFFKTIVREPTPTLANPPSATLVKTMNNVCALLFATTILLNINYGQVSREKIHRTSANSNLLFLPRHSFQCQRHNEWLTRWKLTHTVIENCGSGRVYLL